MKRKTVAQQKAEQDERSKNYRHPAAAGAAKFREEWKQIEAATFAEPEKRWEYGQDILPGGLSYPPPSTVFARSRKNVSSGRVVIIDEVTLETPGFVKRGRPRGPQRAIRVAAVLELCRRAAKLHAVRHPDPAARSVARSLVGVAHTTLSEAPAERLNLSGVLTMDLAARGLSAADQRLGRLDRESAVRRLLERIDREVPLYVRKGRPRDPE
jgi:hypothetical protein